MYIDNEKFYNDIVYYFEEGIIVDDLWFSFKILAERCLNSFRDGHAIANREDMIQSAILHCASNLNKYDYKNNKNAYSFYRTTITNLYLQTMNKEIEFNQRKDQHMKEYENVIDMMDRGQNYEANYTYWGR